MTAGAFVSYLLYFSRVMSIAALPVTPDRPGLPTPRQAGKGSEHSATPTSQPPAAASTQPATQSPSEKPLHPTAGEFNAVSPQQRPDLWALKWFGLRPRLEAAGIDFHGTDTADYSKNFQGGLSTNNDSFRNLLDLRVNVDTKALWGWEGGTFSVDFQNQSGQDGTEVLTGDVQRFDNADANGRSQIAELWYQQFLFDDKLRLKIGKVDANSEFAFPKYGADFLNGSFGHSPTIFAMPTYPDPAMSVNVFVYPNSWSYIGSGVYDGSGAEGVETGSYGPKHFFTAANGYFFIGEIGGKWALCNDTLPGHVAIGGWRSTSDFHRFAGGTASGAGGAYAIVEQMLWHKRDDDKTDPQGVAAFLQYGHAGADLNDFSNHVGAGLSCTGPLNSRPFDIMGIGATYVQLSDEPQAGFVQDFELSIEAFYGFQITQYLSIKPDLQYILHPGGTDNPAALVATLRATLAF